MVVIGASLGGVQALQILLSALPAGFRSPVAIVQHRGRGSDSGLCSLLQAGCPLPVIEPEDKEPLQPGRVYLAPPDYHLLVERDHLALSTEGPVNHSRPSIDVLFETAADAYGPELIAVVLTGASDDGARGAERVALRGGTVLIQDPATAQSAIMPAAAVARTAATRTYSLEEVAARLIVLCAGPPLSLVR
jgi:two-component system, chemotaxis family, protein-glutamate methylesterase/glutaminase